MPIYKQCVAFYRDFEIKARDAKEANEKMEQLVHDTEFQGSVEHDGYEVFEDEPVECPKCKGACVVGEDEEPCDRCNGDGQVPFVAEEKE